MKNHPTAKYICIFIQNNLFLIITSEFFFNFEKKNCFSQNPIIPRIFRRATIIIYEKIEFKNVKAISRKLINMFYFISYSGVKTKYQTCYPLSWLNSLEDLNFCFLSDYKYFSLYE